MPFSEKGYKRILIVALYAVLAVAGVFIFYKFLLSPLLAFITAFAVVCLTRPVVLKLHKLLGISKKLTAVLFNVIIMSLIVLLGYISFARLFSESVALLNFMSSDEFGNVLDKIYAEFDILLQKLSGIRLFSGVSQKGQLIYDLVLTFTKELMPSLLQFFMAFIKIIPDAVIFIVLMFVSMFYIGCDYENIVAFICAQFSPKAKEILFQIKKRIIEVVWELFKAYFLITLLTFSQLLTGFLVLDIKYAVILAIVVSLVDMLPVLGTGTVLIPWAVVCLVLGNNVRAIGLLVIYGIITIVRQIAEPKIVGASIGLYPLVTLIAMYSGLKIMGFAGLIFFPVIVMVIKSLNDKEIIHLYKNPTLTEHQKLQQSKKKFTAFHKKDSED